MKAHSSSQSSDRRSKLPCLLFPEVPFPESSAPESSVSKSSRSQFIPALNRLGSFCGLAAQLLQFGLHPFVFSLVALFFKHLRPTMQCNGPAGCSRLLPEAKVAPTHRSADRRRYGAMLNTFAGLVVTITYISGAAASEIAVKEIRTGEYEFVLTDPITMSEREARSKIANAAIVTCKGRNPVLGKYHFNSEELISGDEQPSLESKGFRFVQEVSCSSSAIAPDSVRVSVLHGEEERRKVEGEVRGKSERYFKLIASREFDGARALLDFRGLSVSRKDWVDQRSAFQAVAGEPVHISI